MTGRSEIRLSLEMIDRAKRRLQYQNAAVAKLSLDRNDRCMYLAREMQTIMQEKIALLQARHASLLQELKT